ncbi:MAG TPA: ABC transporter substrate-binding protein [Burkholderiales bacterium]|nr:ABC transporter substrate-binding protein [Burkholderiales bacterium]
MKRREFLLAAGALAAPLGVRAQSSRVPRIGVIIHSNAWAPIVEGLRAGLKELGVAEGKDVALEVFDAKADAKAIEETARRFERERVRLIYCVPTSAATVVKRATTEVPIFFGVGTDPIASGLVESFAKPGGRLTGVHFLSTDLTAKRLELLKDLVPKLRRVVILYRPGHPPAEASARMAREAGEKLGVQVIERHVRSVPEVRAALAALKAGEADADFQVSDALVSSQFQYLIGASKKIRMPMMVYDQAVVERGALVSYGVDTREVGRQSAKNVQRMLAGARPAELPVETVTRLAFVLNRRTAQEIGLAVPPAMLVRFDRVIE